LKPLTSNLVLAPDSTIDLQMHTINSDGTWIPEQLIDYLASEHFGLVAITDHDRVDTIAALQQLGAQKQLPVLAAVEMSTWWKDAATDILCYNFDPEKNFLSELAQDIARRQCENTRAVYENLHHKGYIPFNSDELSTLLEASSSQQAHALSALIKKYGDEAAALPIGKIMDDAGFIWAVGDIAAIVDAAHRSGAVCLIAHPGRSEGYTCYDETLLDELRSQVPIDGLEVYYPTHTPEQIAMYLEYAQKHHLLISSGSDSHGPNKKPVKYRAELSRSLLERVGIQIR